MRTIVFNDIWNKIQISLINYLQASFHNPVFNSCKYSSIKEVFYQVPINLKNMMNN